MPGGLEHSGGVEGASVVSICLYGRLPEIELTLSNGLHVLSMMTAEGDPAWALTRNDEQSVHVCAGRLRFDNPRLITAKSPSHWVYHRQY